jgi:phage shock protein E
MRHQLVFALVASTSVFPMARAQASSESFNPAIDMAAYLRISNQAAKHRQSRRLSEAEFIRLSHERGTVVLDARSREKYDELHVKGAINLSFPDITFESLARTLPDKNTRVLIYCNNNFRNSEAAFPEKKASAALNLSTYVSLYDYGYENVYELGPLLDPKSSKLAFESSQR